MNYHCIRSNLGFIVGWKNLDVLGRNLKTFSVGISFAEAYKNSPGNIISFEKCGFDDDELQRIYSEMEEEGLAELEDHYVETPNGAVALMKCRQLLSCPEAVGYNPKKLAKIELLRTHLQRIVDGAEKQILVFSCFVAAQEFCGRCRPRPDFRRFRKRSASSFGGVAFNNVRRAQLSKHR